MYTTLKFGVPSSDEREDGTSAQETAGKGLDYHTSKHRTTIRQRCFTLIIATVQILILLFGVAVCLKLPLANDQASLW